MYPETPAFSCVPSLLCEGEERQDCGVSTSRGCPSVTAMVGPSEETEMD